MVKRKKEKSPPVAVIGCGYWGKNLIRNYHNLGALKLICDKNETALADFKSQYADVETCIALADVLTRKDIAGVVISSPAETHFNIAREALLADKNVFVEKPLTLHEEEGRELIALAKERNKILMVGHLLQYHPVFMRLNEMASAGELGRINYIYSNRLNLGKIRREENILWSFAPHDISVILYLLDEEPESVNAFGADYVNKGISDGVCIRFRLGGFVAAAIRDVAAPGPLVDHQNRISWLDHCVFLGHLYRHLARNSLALAALFFQHLYRNFSQCSFPGPAVFLVLRRTDALR